MSLQVALEGLKQGTYDVMAAQFPVTRANKEHYLFTSALYLDNQVLVQRIDSGMVINSQLDLAGDTVNIVPKIRYNGIPVYRNVQSRGEA